MKLLDQLGLFYNTTSERGAALAKRQDRALSQDERLLAYMREIYPRSVTSGQVHRDARIFDKSPRTSVGRSLNSLMQGGHILKLDKMAMGDYGMLVHLWQYNIIGAGK
jgi:hypothetical protein